MSAKAPIAVLWSVLLCGCPAEPDILITVHFDNDAAEAANEPLLKIHEGRCDVCDDECEPSIPNTGAPPGLRAGDEIAIFVDRSGGKVHSFDLWLSSLPCPPDQPDQVVFSMTPNENDLPASLNLVLCPASLANLDPEAGPFWNQQDVTECP